MAIDLFGYQLNKKDLKKELQSFSVSRQLTAEALIPEGWYTNAGGMTSVPYEIMQTPTDQLDLIRSYRDLAASAQIDQAVQEIRNEIFIYDVPDKLAFMPQFKQKSKISKSIQKKIIQQFQYLYEMMDFDFQGTQWFDDWYVDSKLYIYKIINSSKPSQGIQRVQFIDPLRIRLVRLMPKPNSDGTFDLNEVKEFYIYSSFDPKQHPLGQPIQLSYGSSIQGLQIKKDSVAYINSGLFDRNLGKYVGYLKKAIQPYNMLKMMEDAMVIFRVVRAPQRRAFYLDVAGMQKNKAEEYIKNTMAKFKNKMVYDTKTGTLSDRKNVLSMMEDYWLPRREGKSTEIQNIEGQNSNDIMDEIEYLRDRLWRALNVPRGRFGDQQTMQLFGANTELQRDEYRFTKFLHLLRSRFILIIEDILKTQLVLKKIIDESEWLDVKRDIIWNYTEDNAFTEAKQTNILNNRMAALAQADPFVNTYFSLEWVQRNILRFTDSQISTENTAIQKYMAEHPPEDPNNPQGGTSTDFQDTRTPDSQDNDEQGNRTILR